MRYYSQYVLACEDRARKLNKDLGSDFFIPLGIMVSDDTNARTLELLTKNGYFGLRQEQVFMLKQDMVPALIDNDAKLSLNDKGEIQVKPHGHGDIHNLLFESGVAAKWRDLGKEWMMFI